MLIMALMYIPFHIHPCSPFRCLPSDILLFSFIIHSATLLEEEIHIGTMAVFAPGTTGPFFNPFNIAPAETWNVPERA